VTHVGQPLRLAWVSPPRSATTSLTSFRSAVCRPWRSASAWVSKTHEARKPGC
jgi:hypothetical protein